MCRSFDVCSETQAKSWEECREKRCEKVAKLEFKKSSASKFGQDKPLPTITKISTQKILLYAHFVAARGTIDLLRRMLHILEKTIEARKRCAEWFQETKFNNGQSDEGHLYFIRILEKIFVLLKLILYHQTPVSSSTSKPIEHGIVLGNLSSMKILTI